MRLKIRVWMNVTGSSGLGSEDDYAANRLTRQDS